MKDFFKFDDKRIVSILWLFISLCILILSICAIKVIEVFVATLFSQQCVDWRLYLPLWCLFCTRKSGMGRLFLCS